MLQVRLLGELQAEVDGAAVAMPASRRAWALLAWLALHPGEHARGAVAARFWPDVLDSSARASLRSALWELRRALADDTALVTGRDRIALRCETDLAEFDAHVAAGRPVEEVWKLLYDPTRMVEWWEGIERVDGDGHDGKGNLTIYPDGYPDFPMPQELRTAADGRGLTISCLVSYLVFEWRLEPLDAGTRIRVHVEIPAEEAHRLETQRAGVSASLRSLAALATATA